MSVSVVACPRNHSTTRCATLVRLLSLAQVGLWKGLFFRCSCECRSAEACTGISLSPTEVLAFGSPWLPNAVSESRVKAANGADAFEQRGDVEDGGLRLPLADDLHVDRQPFLARAEPHRDARQPGDVERHG